MADDRLQERADAFLADLASEDDLGVVLRSHLRMEHELVDFIGSGLPDPSALGQCMDYSAKVRLALAMGLDPQLKAALNAIGTIRNRFAHKLGEKITKGDADNLYGTFTPFMKDAVQQGRKLPRRGYILLFVSWRSGRR